MRERQIKTTVRYHATSVRTVKIPNTDTTERGWGCGVAGTLTHCCWECKVLQPLGNTVQRLLTKLNVLLPHDPSVSLLGIYSNSFKIYIHTKTCKWMFLALFIIAKTRKRPRYICFSSWMNTQTPVYPDDEMWFRANKQWAIKQWKDTE